jgi:outer membrane protein TolC
MKNRLTTASLVLLVALLAGCAHFRSQPLSAEQTAAQLDARRLDDAGLKKFLDQNLGGDTTDWPKTNWNFRELMLVGFYFHPDLAVARAEWLVARGGMKTAGARLNPSVTVNPAYDTQIPGNYSPWMVPVTFDLPIETAGKRGKRIAEAKKKAESARFIFMQAAWQVRNGVRTALQDFNIAGRRAALLQQQLGTQKQMVRLLQQRLAAGEISRPDLLLQQIALNHTQLDLSAALAARSDARSQLAQALGLPLAALQGLKLRADDAAPDIKTLTSAEARRVALRSRADILAALADYEASEAELQLQIARQYPDLHLGPGYAWNNGNAGDNQWSLGVTMELPVLDQNQGPMAEAEATRKLSAAKFMALQAQVIAGIDRAVAGFQVAREQWRTGNDLFRSEQQQQKSAAAQIKAGATDQLDWLGAQLELSNARLTQLNNQAQLETARAALEDALQQPADSGIIEKLSTQNPDIPEAKSSKP